MKRSFRLLFFILFLILKIKEKKQLTIGQVKSDINLRLEYYILLLIILFFSEFFCRLVDEKNLVRKIDLHKKIMNLKIRLLYIYCYKAADGVWFFDAEK